MSKRWPLRLGLALASAALAFVLLGEAALRTWRPASVRLFEARVRGSPGERVIMIDETYEVHPKHGVFQVDPRIGYRPVLGGAKYAPHGAQWNDYALRKPPGKRRLLFIGDSVTDRAKLITALSEQLGDAYEYWNAGVVGYTTTQELAYYRDYLADIPADHVILTFHLNDYEITPVVFELDGQYVSVHSRIGNTYPNPWLLKNSYLYRFGWSWMVSRTGRERAESMESEVQDGLRALRDLVRARGADFSVLVLPWLAPRAEWHEPEPRHHELTLRTLTQLGIRHFAFLETLDRAYAAGLPIHEQGVDPQHPSLEFAREMVKDSLLQGFRP
ncbi:MAG: SGNH/GDSL hydrolase family protein [Planctomycetes bacterium]|nr:SGNH/GDSL hydrolase family protein [Planctomycetota bacterium]